MDDEKKIFNYVLVILIPLSLAITQMFLTGINLPDQELSKDLYSNINLSNTLYYSAENSNNGPANIFPKNLKYPEISDHQNSKRTQGTAPVVVIYFNGIPSTVQITKAPLKYNKHFAYSFTLDDGKDNAYTGAYPLLSGGYSSETGTSYPGLNYTDGCGNNIPFKAGIAINSVGGNGEDTHQGTPGTVTWEQIIDLYNKDWDVFNHSYSHKYGPGTDYNAQIIDNNNYIKSKTGIDLSHFVIPSGDPEYAPYAFNLGMKAVYNQTDCQGIDGMQVDSPTAMQNLKLCRQYLNDDNYNTFAGIVDAVAAKSSSAIHYWYNEFTHHVSQDPQPGGSLVFSTFQQHMNKLETKYGAKGLDNMWMAPLQEVYEYLYIRELTTLENIQESDKAYVNINNFNLVATDLRRYSMTFIVDSDKDITKVECLDASLVSFKGTGLNKIINIEWKNHPFEITTGLKNDLNRNAQVNAYPNPVENELTLDIPGIPLQRVFISVVDEKGIEYNLGENKVENERTTVRLGKLNLKRGIYIIKASSADGKIQYSKLIMKD